MDYVRGVDVLAFFSRRAEDSGDGDGGPTA
jgi:hypothetical protein